MQQEKRIILRMLEEGKITAEEAEALLNALGDKTAPDEPESQEDPWSRLEKMGDDFASKVEVATERFAKSLEHKAEGFGDKLSKLPKVLAKFPFFGYEESQEFTSVIRGPVRMEKEVISINFANPHGSIRVQGWSKEDYQLTVVQRLRGNDRDLLRGRLYDVDWSDGDVRDDFALTVPNQVEGIVSLHLMVPERRVYAVKLNSYNGSLRLENLEGTTIEMETINGSSSLRSVKCEIIQGQISNGSCKMDGVEAQTIRYETGNGSYRLLVSAVDIDCLATNGSVNLRVNEIQKDCCYRLRTTNGSINVGLPHAAVSVDLRTSVGRVSTTLGKLETIQEERKGGGAALVARSLDFAEKSPKVVLDASSTSGSITVGLTKESD